MLLADLVACSSTVGATAKRSEKTAAIAGLLDRLDPSEAEAAVGFLVGLPRQGKVGVGWSTVGAIHVSPVPDPSLTISELDLAVERVRDETGPGSAGRRREVLADVLARATAAEQDFVRRLFVGELRQGALAGVMLEALARATGLPAADVRRAVMLDGDLARAGAALLAGQRGESGFVVMRPVLPMLATSVASVEEALAGVDEASVEWKLDGIRIQVHRLGDEVSVFTRNLNEITGRLPQVVEAVRALDVDSLVFDGEALAFHEGARPEAFQATMSRVGRRSEAAQGVVGFAFDCLHAGGRDLLDEPLRTRLDVLDTVAGHLRIPGAVTSDADEASRVLDEALAAGHEGVMVKDVDSPYSAGRRGRSWRKVKPVRTLDLVVLGAEWGHGRRRGWLSNLHLGARDPASGGFVMVGKTFKGLTDEMLRRQTEALLSLESHRDGITVFVRPELVVEIALDGAQSSTRYPGGVALRFARVRRYREDRSPADADTIQAVRSLLPGL